MADLLSVGDSDVDVSRLIRKVRGRQHQPWGGHRLTGYLSITKACLAS